MCAYLFTKMFIRTEKLEVIEYKITCVKIKNKTTFFTLLTKNLHIYPPQNLVYRFLQSIANIILY